MKNMSFSATWPQILESWERVRRGEAPTKDLTRRMKCNLKPGERFQAVRKQRGLKKGEHVERGPELVCVSNEVERLDTIAFRPCRMGMPSKSEVAREGFPDMNNWEFIEMFARLNRGCNLGTMIHRVEFKYIVEGGA